MNKSFYRKQKEKKQSPKSPLNFQVKERIRKELRRLNIKTRELIASHSSDSARENKNPNIVLDPWQTTALDALEQGCHVIVDAPTSAGKTKVIESYINKHIKENFKIIYTSPVKSLSNDKYF